VLSCEERGLVVLGQTAAPRYQVAITIHQSPWAGNVGLFFGYQDRVIDGQQASQYQVIELATEPRADQGRPLFRIDWRSVTHLGPPGRQRTANKALHNSDSFTLGPAEHRLELAVGANGLEAVSLDGKVLDGLNAAAVKAPPRANYDGQFGVYLNTGNGVFRDAQYMFWEQP
jgi:hypothetical protein